MIKHVVCFKLKDNSNFAKEEAKNVLLGMKGKVPSITNIEVGTDFLGSARSFDVILVITLKDKEMLEVYQNDKYHCEVVKPYMHSHITNSVAIDYEID